MEYVIWGIGIRGKRVADFVGYENVKAFVDSDKAFQGMDYNGIPIVDIEQYIEIYRKCLLIVSPMDNKMIVDMIERHGICTYLVLDECPQDIQIGLIEGIHEIELPDINYNKAIIYGGSLYSILLWEHLVKKGFTTTLLLNEVSEGKKLLLKSISERVYCMKEHLSETPCMILKTVRENPQINNAVIIDLFQLNGFVKKYYHPSLCRYRNLHKDEKCFIVGNGSSLKIDDLDRLCRCNMTCFGMNGIPIIFKDTIWRPKYYVCEDAKGMDIFGDLVMDERINNIFIADTNSAFCKKVKNHRNINLFHLYMENYLPELPQFSENIEEYVYCGYTVTYACIQIAVYMGYKEIYLLGMDFDYNDGETVQVKHFTKEYHSDEKKINPCKKIENLLAYKAAKKYADTRGIKIYNATRGGALEVFDRVDFDSLFK